MPDNEAIDDATVNVQAFVFNMYGAIDNLAWIWVGEKDITQANGKPLSRKRIGLGPDNVDVRQSLPEPARQSLSGYDSWFEHLRDFRDALAHRIPLYIPPYMVSPQNVEAYKALERQRWQAGNEEEFDATKQKMRQFEFFRPIIKHSLYDNQEPIVFHPQLLGDFKTVEQIALTILEALKGRIDL